MEVLQQEAWIRGSASITYDTVAEDSFPPGRPPLDEYKASSIVRVQQVYQQPPGINKVSGENRHFRRAEMET